MLEPGYILLTRNFTEEENGSPGFWNHASMVYRDKRVLEAQAEPPGYKNGAIGLTPGFYFWERYPEILVLKPKNIDGEALCEAAEKYIGGEYRKVASFFNVLRKPTKGENCVSLVRRIYKDVLGRDPKWRIPDHLAEDGLFEKVMHKVEYDSWVEPTDWYIGFSMEK